MLSEAIGVMLSEAIGVMFSEAVGVHSEAIGVGVASDVAAFRSHRRDVFRSHRRAFRS